MGRVKKGSLEDISLGRKPVVEAVGSTEGEVPNPEASESQGDLEVEEVKSVGVKKRRCTWDVTDEAWAELAKLTVDERSEQRVLVAEALNLLFKKYGRPQVA